MFIYTYIYIYIYIQLDNGLIKVTKYYNCYTRKVSETKYKSIYGEGSKY